MIHLGLSSLLAAAQQAWHLQNAQKHCNHSTAHPATPFKLSMAATAAKFRAWCEVEAEKAESDKDEDASGVPSFWFSFQLSGHLFPLWPQCKQKNIGVLEIRGHLSRILSERCLKAKYCRKCLDTTWSSGHECSEMCGKCGERGHVSARHKHHEADMNYMNLSARRAGSGRVPVPEVLWLLRVAFPQTTFLPVYTGGSTLYIWRTQVGEL